MKRQNVPKAKIKRKTLHRKKPKKGNNIGGKHFFSNQAKRVEIRKTNPDRRLEKERLDEEAWRKEKGDSIQSHYKKKPPGRENYKSSIKKAILKVTKTPRAPLGDTGDPSPIF